MMDNQHFDPPFWSQARPCRKSRKPYCLQAWADASRSRKVRRGSGFGHYLSASALRRNAAQRGLSDTPSTEPYARPEAVGCRAPRSSSVHRRPAVGFADEIGDTFRPHFRHVLTPRRDFAVIAGLEGLGLVVAGHGDLAAQ